MRDLSEKYLAIHRDFPNRGGKLRQLLEVQKRLATNIVKTKPSGDVASLVLASLEGYEVAIELLDYMQQFMNGVAQDATVLMDGSELRMAHKMQSDEILLGWKKIHELMDYITATRPDFGK